MRTHINRQRLLASTIIGGAALLAFAAPAMAQTAPQEPEATVDDIVVTGSRIPQANLVTNSPITQVTAEDIDVQGVTRVEDLVNQLPQAFAAQNSTVSNGASGTATVSLRNLGSDRTLVLIDGRRMGYGSPTDTAADLNQIPGQLVERVEVLTGGASAVYGSDAVAGVVNFIMKKDFEGIQIDAQYGFYQHNNDYDGPGNLRNEIARRGQTNPANFALPEDDVSDGESREVTLTMGISSPDGKGNILAYAGYRNNNPILQRDRDYSACSLGAPSAAAPTTYTCGGSGTSFPGQFTNFGVGGPSFAFTVGPNGTFVPYSAANNAYNFGPINYYQRPDERYTLGAFGRYQINDNAEAFAQLMFSDYESVAQIAPSGSFFNNSTINCDNPLLSAQQRTAISCTPALIASGGTVPLYIGRRNVEGGGRQDSLNYESYRAVVGVRGAITEGWNYDVAAQFSRVRLSETYLNDFSITRLARALDVINVNGVPTCRSVTTGVDAGCVPYNVFSSGGVTQAALDYLQIPLVQTGDTTQQVVTAAVTGDLGVYGIQSPFTTNGIKVAFGTEYRRDALESVTDTSFSTGDGAGQGGPRIGLKGAVDVVDIFGEVQVPLADEQAWAYSASVDAAYRRSEYKNLTTDTYKFGADYAPIEDVRLRASYSRAVRAPNVIELFAAQGLGLFDIDFDPCGPSRTATAAECALTGVTATQYGSATLDSPAGQYNQLTGGNPNVEPEESDTFTFGVVFTPSFLPRFNMSVDYFDIQVDGLISTVGAANTLDLCYNDNDAAACDRINRNPNNGSLWIGDTAFVENLNINIGGLKTSGVDINANYNIDLEDLGLGSFGSVGLAYVATILDSLESDTGTQTASSVYDCTGYYGSAQCGIPNPEYRHRARATWSTPWDVDVSGTWRYYSEVEFGSSLTGGVAGRLDSKLDAQYYLDLAASWQVTDTLSARVGINNILDRDPPLSTSAGTGGNGNTYPQLYDALGRYAFFSVTANF
ncbi:TonB-dependent receptor domain-containing protein [Brevundimonas variabilis]|uniref:Outer membrane receptor protein involved in Fe transport n=1 Tax=Brevundimonas variabilis TaxID=74312 RepID=A0A7W9CH43_9CAUL|nr:TonB-dependent receptor [Brevundimonas variabilis]MBB5745553.1 outer membrane receptor protein involved in Fe transport [Brevundimonas variabilis]